MKSHCMQLCCIDLDTFFARGVGKILWKCQCHESMSWMTWKETRRKRYPFPNHTPILYPHIHTRSATTLPKHANAKIHSNVFVCVSEFMESFCWLFPFSLFFIRFGYFGHFTFLRCCRCRHSPYETLFGWTHLQTLCRQVCIHNVFSSLAMRNDIANRWHRKIPFKNCTWTELNWSEVHCVYFFSFYFHHHYYHYHGYFVYGLQNAQHTLYRVHVFAGWFVERTPAPDAHTYWKMNVFWEFCIQVRTADG